MSEDDVIIDIYMIIPAKSDLVVYLPAQAMMLSSQCEITRLSITESFITICHSLGEKNAKQPSNVRCAAAEFFNERHSIVL